MVCDYRLGHEGENVAMAAIWKQHLDLIQICFLSSRRLYATKPSNLYWNRANLAPLGMSTSFTVDILHANSSIERDTVPRRYQPSRE